MGAWADLDANYPPGTLTPATALIVALGQLEGARSIYADPALQRLAAFLPRQGIGYDRDLRQRAEHYLQDVPLAQFLSEARALLHPRQKLCLALNLLDAVLGAGRRPASDERLLTLLEGLGLTFADLQPYQAVLALKQDLELFPQ